MGKKGISAYVSGFIRSATQTTLLLIASTAAAQVDSLAGDSTSLPSLYNYHDARVQYFVGQQIADWVYEDTTLNGFYNYQPARKNTLFEPVLLGNLGAPYTQRWFTFDRSLEIDYGRNEREAYTIELDELQYWRTNVPFTRLYYLAGQFGEQNLRVFHTRNFGPQWNMSILFDKIVSVGYYQHQNNDYGNTAITLWYKTKNEKYSIYFGGIRGKLTSDDNGGINNDTLFDYPNPELAEPFRDKAFTEWSNWQGRVMQKFVFYKSHTVVETDTQVVVKYFPRATLQHVFSATNHYYLFEDAGDQSFYPELFYAMDTLRDRSQFVGVTNTLRFTTIPLKADSAAGFIHDINALRFSASLTHQLYNVSDQAGITPFQQLIADGQVFKNFPFMHAHLKGQFEFTQQNYLLQLQLLGARRNPLNLEATFASLPPSIMDIRYHGFARQWEYDFADSINLLQIHGYFKVADPKVSLHVQYSRLQNFYVTTQTYAYDPGDIAYIISAPADFSVTQAWLQTEFTPGPFVLRTALGAQGDPDDALNQPSAIINAEWFYQGYLFKNALFTQAGLTGWWSSTYKALPYDFITGRFVYFSNDFFAAPVLQEYSFPPVINAFISADIRTFRFVLQMENIADGLFNKGFYQAPDYPQTPRAFKLGIQWDLFY